MRSLRSAFLRKALAPDETLLFEARPHLSCYRHALFVPLAGLFISIALFILYAESPLLALIGLGGFAIGWLEWLAVSCTQCIITDKRIICKTGVLTTQILELKNAKIEAITLSQSFLGKLLGYATLTFSGTGSTHVQFRCISRPFAAKQAADAAIANARRP